MSRDNLYSLKFDQPHSWPGSQSQVKGSAPMALGYLTDSFKKQQASMSSKEVTDIYTSMGINDSKWKGMQKNWPLDVKKF